MHWQIGAYHDMFVVILIVVPPYGGFLRLYREASCVHLCSQNNADAHITGYTFLLSILAFPLVLNEGLFALPMVLVVELMLCITGMNKECFAGMYTNLK